MALSKEHDPAFDLAADGEKAVPNDGIHPGDSPFSWPTATKWRVTLVACYVTLTVGINSTGITAAVTPINEEFDVSDARFPNSYWPVTSWNVGAAIAPMVVLPVMENNGVRIGYLTTYALFVIFVIPQAVAQNFATLVVTRFFAGCCGGVLQTVMDGIIADVWEESSQRSLPVTLYVFFLLFGVTLGPVTGGAITTSLNWRWIFYVQLIIYGASAPLVFFAFKEPRTPSTIQKATQQHETAQTRPLPTLQHMKTLIWEAVGRPTYMLFTEPTVFFFTLLSALAYGIIFMSTQSVTQVFTALYSFTEPATGLAQASILIGEIFGLAACVLQNIWYKQRGPEPEPESRLPIAIIGTFVGLAAGLFVYGWTSTPTYHWAVPSVGLALTGFGSVTVMQAIMMYVTDAYVAYAASASAAVCLGENSFAAFLPLATMRMYGELGFDWASSLLGFVALALGVAPVVLMLKGAAVRRRSAFMKEAGS